MRVRSISVRKLFGRFDHTIPLNQGERITIIHGPNGYGKTALLRLVHAVFHLEVDEMRAIPFESLRVDLDDGAHLQIDWKTLSSNSRAAIYRIRVGEDLLSEFVWGTKEQNFVDVASYADRYVRARQESSRPPSTRDLLAFLKDRRKSVEDFVFQKVWLHHVPVHVISVHRLLTPTRKGHAQQVLGVRAGQPGEGREETFERTVLVYSDELRDAVGSIKAEYAGKSQQLDSAFPMRAMEAMNAPPVPEHELKRKFEDLDQQRRWLDSLGILPSADTQVSMPGSVGDDAARKVLWLYACDVEDKLAVFNELADRVSLLQEIINQRFQFKRLKLDGERGFVFESDTGQELPPTALSSGEQHQLIMAYECLFRIDEDALLLIDEPELSLHVSWQVEFLHDLQRIIEIAKFDVLIATHSPQIIHDRWDLTVELQPPSEPPASMTSEVPVVEQGAALE
jgi:predicted ATP-binding protein involved in virulence